MCDPLVGKVFIYYEGIYNSDNWDCEKFWIEQILSIGLFYSQEDCMVTKSIKNWRSVGGSTEYLYSRRTWGSLEQFNRDLACGKVRFLGCNGFVKALRKFNKLKESPA
jgi:hypothetical protein